jgi:hypothetical protein
MGVDFFYLFGYTINIIFIMAKKKMPHSTRKYIRKEKSRIRRQVLDIKEQDKKIEELYQKATKYEKNTNIRKNEK